MIGILVKEMNLEMLEKRRKVKVRKGNQRNGKTRKWQLNQRWPV